MINNIYYLFSVKDKYFTEFSKLFKKNKPHLTFSGLAYAKNKVLFDPIYTHVSFVSDILKREGEVDYVFLEGLEQKYNMNISEMLHADRHLSRYCKEKRLFIAQEMIRTFIDDLNKYHVDLVMPEGVDDFISFFAAQYCKFNNIKFLYAIEIGYAARSCITGHIYPEPDHFRDIFSKNKQLVNEGKINLIPVKNEVESYVKHKRKPSYYSGTNEADYRALQLKDLKIFMEYIVSYLRDSHSLPLDKNPLFLPYFRILKIYRKILYKQLLRNVSIIPSKLKNLSYLIYPLHFEPESSTLIQGRWLNDQAKIIEMISKNLPINTVLLVKEHRISIGRRALSFYKEIIKYHNVFLVDDAIDTYPFIENSKGVILISSTMGLEALMLRKPVLSFGERYYNVSNNVYVAENYREIGLLIKKMLSHQFDEVNLLTLFYTLFETTQNLGNTCHFEYTTEDLNTFTMALEASL